MGWRAGAFLSLILAWLVGAPGQEHWRAHGPMNVGHESLSCDSCHRPAPGTVRQQLQASVRYWLGQRATPADFGNRDVDNGDCVACHERAFDRHPVFRFSEPRFEEARARLGADRCEGCHGEHRGAKVVREPEFCKTCHSDLTLERDPLDVTHHDLVESEQWATCLGCHDFHGNHARETPKQVRDAIGPDRILRYFAGGDSPYGSNLISPPHKERPYDPVD